MHEQAAVLASTQARLLKRGSESLIGIASGLIADGELNTREIQFLSTWLSENQELKSTWPGEVIYKRVREVLADGIVSFEEKKYLQKTLTDLVGGSFAEHGAIPSEPIFLPLDQAAIVQIPSLSFCFTGNFIFGTRSACEGAVVRRGGRIANVNKRLNFLVIGELSSRDWKYSSFGGKIESLMNLKNKGASTLIVSEAQWIRAF